jgi:hypothetical protein
MREARSAPRQAATPKIAGRIVEYGTPVEGELVDAVVGRWLIA